MFSSAAKSLFFSLTFVLTSFHSVSAQPAKEVKKVDAKKTVEPKETVQKLVLRETDKGLDIKVNDKTSMSLVGKSEGIRHKKVALFNINVYQAKLYVPAESAKIKDAAALLATTPKAMKINPMRSFGGDKLKEAMLVSYEVNKVDPNSESQKEFLGMISKHKIEKNKPVHLVGFTSDGKDELHLIMQDMNEVIKGHSGFVKEVFSVWLGTAVDGDMTKLQEIITN